jgi:hypothetical protein
LHAEGCKFESRKAQRNIGTQHWLSYCFNQSGGYFSAVRGIGKRVWVN